MEFIRNFIFGMEAHLQGTWATTKADKCLYTLFHRRDTAKDEYTKEFDIYIKVI